MDAPWIVSVHDLQCDDRAPCLENTFHIPYNLNGNQIVSFVHHWLYNHAHLLPHFYTKPAAASTTLFNNKVTQLNFYFEHPEEDYPVLCDRIAELQDHVGGAVTLRVNHYQKSDYIVGIMVVYNDILDRKLRETITTMTAPFVASANEKHAHHLLASKNPDNPTNGTIIQYYGAIDDGYHYHPANEYLAAYGTDPHTFPALVFRLSIDKMPNMLGNDFMARFPVRTLVDIWVDKAALESSTVSVWVYDEGVGYQARRVAGPEKLCETGGEVALYVSDFVGVRQVAKLLEDNKRPYKRQDNRYVNPNLSIPYSKILSALKDLEDKGWWVRGQSLPPVVDKDIVVPKFDHLRQMPRYPAVPNGGVMPGGRRGFATVAVGPRLRASAVVRGPGGAHMLAKGVAHRGMKGLWRLLRK